MSKRGKVKQAVESVADKVAGKATAGAKKAKAVAAEPTGGISPNPMTNLVIADLALRIGGQILRHTVERGVLGQKYGNGKAKKIIKGRSMGQTLVSTAIARVATRSVPGAIVVGGGLLAKALFDRRHAKGAKVDGKEAVEKQIEDGSEA